MAHFYANFSITSLNNSANSKLFLRTMLWRPRLMSWMQQPRPLYCITPALDRYVSLPDRTPCTWMMTSLNICSMAFYDLWHPWLFTSVHPFCFHLSQPPIDKTYPWLIPVKLGYHPQISQPQPDLWHLSLWRKCGKCSGRDNQ